MTYLAIAIAIILCAQECPSGLSPASGCHHICLDWRQDMAISSVPTRIKNIQGMKFGRLTVVSFLQKSNDKRESFWLCRCECGTEKIVAKSNIGRGVRSCGCLRQETQIASGKKTGGHNKLDLCGQKFGRLTVVSPSSGRRNGKQIWNCFCECGNECLVGTSQLTSEKTRSCGCLRKIASNARSKDSWKSIHGHSGSSKGRPTLAYSRWQSMKSRCKSAVLPAYRNVNYDQRWNDFQVFLKEVGSPPSKEHSLDRYPDPKGDYRPGNVRWATALEQARNKTTCVMLTCNGTTQCLSAWAEALKVSPMTIRQRLNKGMSVHEALTTPRKGRTKNA